MRTLAVAALTGLVALAVAGSASAAPSISLLWTGTTGSGTTGSSSIDAVAGDTLTLDVIMSVDAAGVSGWEFSLLGGAAVNAQSGQECPAGASSGSFANFFAGSCFTGVGFIAALAPGVIVAGGDVLNYDGGAVPGTAGPLAQPMFIGQAVFTVNGNGQVDFGGLATVVDAAFNTTVINGVSATIVPEPGTMGLMGLGMVALGLAGRRRK